MNGISSDFEQSDSARRVRLVLSEILQMQAQITEYNQNKNSNTEYSVKPSELFDNDVYLEEITDVICISLAELPNLLNICDVVEVLLHVNKGPVIISWVTANMPDTLQEGKNYVQLNISVLNHHHVNICEKATTHWLKTSIVPGCWSP